MKKSSTNFIYLYSQNVVLGHVEIIFDEIVVHVTKVKMVMLRIRVKVAKQLLMMGLHVVIMRKMVGDVAVSSNVTSVNAQANRVILEMAAMVNQKIMRTQLLKIMGQDAAEIHGFVHEIDQAKVLR